jgi:hypothetical protein
MFFLPNHVHILVMAQAGGATCILQCIMHCGVYIISPAHGLCYLVANLGLCVATVGLWTAVVRSGIWAHGQALDALRGCCSCSCLHGPAMVPAQGVPWGGCHNRLPHPPAGSFYGVNKRLHGPAHCN